MLKGSKQPWTAASGLLLYVDDSNNYKHNHANKVFKQSLRTEIQQAKEMPVRRMLHQSGEHVCLAARRSEAVKQDNVIEEWGVKLAHQ